MQINVIDRDFNYLGQIDNYTSLQLRKKWHSVGDFELQLHENTLHADKLVKENIIYTADNKAYIILHREFNTVTETLIVKGRELKSYLARWLIYPPDATAYYRINDKIETIMKTYVSATLTRKGVTNITVATDQSRGEKTVFQSRYKNLAEELEKLSIASSVGWDITLDTAAKEFVFDCYIGTDRTAEQDINSNAIFSVDYDNISEQRLVDSNLNYFNTAIVAGQGEGADREISIVGDIGLGLDSFETFVDARDIENTDDLIPRGEQKLADTQPVLSFDSVVDVTKNLQYGVDFNLGDMVTIQNIRWGITENRRLTGVTEIYEANGFRLEAGFGEPIKTLTDRIKEATSQPISESSAGIVGDLNWDGGKSDSVYGGMDSFDGGGI